MKKQRNSYWQIIRGICILAVVLIHALSGFDYNSNNEINTAWILVRQIVNFPVATFVFLSGYFVDPSKMQVENYTQEYIVVRSIRLLIPFVLWSGFYTLITIVQNVSDGISPDIKELIVRFIVGKASTPFYYIVVLFQLTLITPMLTKLINKESKLLKYLWLITPVYLLYLYIYII